MRLPGLPSQTWPWLEASHMAARECGFFSSVPGVCWATVYPIEKWRQMLGKADPGPVSLLVRPAEWRAPCHPLPA